MTTPRPGFSVAADETTYRRLGAVIREKVLGLQNTSYMLGVQAHTGMTDPRVTRQTLDALRNKIGSDLESLLMLIDLMAEMKDVRVTSGLKPERRVRTKVKDPVEDPAAAEMVDQALAEAGVSA